MQTVRSEVLDDGRYLVPEPTPGEAGVAWLRAHVARFANGERAARLRQVSVEVIEAIGVAAYEASPTATLLAALSLPVALEQDVATVAAAYLPHLPQTAAGDAAADRLVAACGGRTDEAAAIVGVLAQSHAATAALIDRLRTGSEVPPVPTTRRVDPDGSQVSVDLADAWFGRGPHRCPGETLARHLAASALSS